MNPSASTSAEARALSEVGLRVALTLPQGAALDGKLKIVRSEECLRSRQHRGVSILVIHETDAVEILRTEMEAGSSLDHLELGDRPVFHHVIDGSPAFRTPTQSADLMPGDSIAFNDAMPYGIYNRAPARSIILSVVLRTRKREDGA